MFNSVYFALFKGLTSSQTFANFFKGQPDSERAASSLMGFEEKLQYIPEGECQQMQQCGVFLLMSITLKCNNLADYFLN